MRTFTEAELREYWRLMKKGMRISATMEKYKITRDEAIELYDQAAALHGGGLRTRQKIKMKEAAINYRREIDRVPIYTPDPPKHIQRPPAKYDNMSREDYINKYLNMDV